MLVPGVLPFTPSSFSLLFPFTIWAQVSIPHYVSPAPLTPLNFL